MYEAGQILEATERHGVWYLEDGVSFYASQLGKLFELAETLPTEKVIHSFLSVFKKK